jgi:hypothetical protein
MVVGFPHPLTKAVFSEQEQKLIDFQEFTSHEKRFAYHQSGALAAVDFRTGEHFGIVNMETLELLYVFRTPYRCMYVMAKLLGFYQRWKPGLWSPTAEERREIMEDAYKMVDKYLESHNIGCLYKVAV